MRNYERFLTGCQFYEVTSPIEAEQLLQFDPQARIKKVHGDLDWCVTPTPTTTTTPPSLSAQLAAQAAGVTLTIDTGPSLNIALLDHPFSRQTQGVVKNGDGRFVVKHQSGGFGTLNELSMLQFFNKVILSTTKAPLSCKQLPLQEKLLPLSTSLENDSTNYLKAGYKQNSVLFLNLIANQPGPGCIEECGCLKSHSTNVASYENVCLGDAGAEILKHCPCLKRKAECHEEVIKMYESVKEARQSMEESSLAKDESQTVSRRLLELRKDINRDTRKLLTDQDKKEVLHRIIGQEKHRKRTLRKVFKENLSRILMTTSPAVPAGAAERATLSSSSSLGRKADENNSRITTSKAASPPAAVNTNYAAGAGAAAAAQRELQAIHYVNTSGSAYLEQTPSPGFNVTALLETKCGDHLADVCDCQASDGSNCVGGLALTEISGLRSNNVENQKFEEVCPSCFDFGNLQNELYRINSGRMLWKGSTGPRRELMEQVKTEHHADIEAQEAQASSKSASRSLSIQMGIPLLDFSCEVSRSTSLPSCTAQQQIISDSITAAFKDMKNKQMPETQLPDLDLLHVDIRLAYEELLMKNMFCVPDLLQMKADLTKEIIPMDFHEKLVLEASKNSNSNHLTGSETTGKSSSEMVEERAKLVDFETKNNVIDTVLNSKLLQPSTSGVGNQVLTGQMLKEYQSACFDSTAMTDVKTCALVEAVLGEEEEQNPGASTPIFSSLLTSDDLERLGAKKFYHLMQPDSSTGLIQPGPFCCVMGMLKNLGKKDCMKLFEEKFQTSTLGGTSGELYARAELSIPATAATSGGNPPPDEPLTGSNAALQQDRLAMLTDQQYEEALDKAKNLQALTDLILTTYYALQKYRTSINRITNFFRRKNGICNADFAKKQDLSCIFGISTSTILLRRIPIGETS